MHYPTSYVDRSVYYYFIFEVMFNYIVVIISDSKFSIKDEVLQGRPLYLDAQATTPMVSDLVFPRRSFKMKLFSIGSESIRRYVAISNLILWKSTFQDTLVWMGIGESYGKGSTTNSNVN